MVQIKQKFNKINIMAFITCFMLVVVFVFGCVSFAYASDNGDSEMSSVISSCPANYYVVGKFDHVNGNKNFIGGWSAQFDTEPSRICAVLVTDGNMSSGYSIYSDVPYSNNYQWGGNTWSSWGSNVRMSTYGFYYCGGNTALSKCHDCVSNMIVFSNKEDATNYMLTGEINNAIYQPKDIVETDNDIEVPLNLDIRLNGESNFIPNLKITCNQSENIDSRFLEISYSTGYRATWELMGAIGLNIKSKTSPVVYGSVEMLEDKYNNSNTVFEAVMSLSKFSQSTAPNKEMFAQYEPTPKLYWSLKEIKNENSEIKIWVRNRVGNKASKWVMVSGDSYKANFNVVESDENGNPTDMKDEEMNSNTGYGSDYWNNRDITPSTDISSDDAISNIKGLKSNYSNLISFFKELFGFLPTEIWVLLIGLVSTMVVIAIVKFIRG